MQLFGSILNYNLTVRKKYRILNCFHRPRHPPPLFFVSIKILKILEINYFDYSVTWLKFPNNKTFLPFLKFNTLKKIQYIMNHHILNGVGKYRKKNMDIYS